MTDQRHGQGRQEDEGPEPDEAPDADLHALAAEQFHPQQAGERADRQQPRAVAPRDRSRDTAEGMDDYVVILHDGLTHGAGIEMDSPRLRELGVTRTDRDQLHWVDPEPITDDAHRDPVPGFEGRWLAGFAPVGGTGFVVIVQTRYDAAVEPNARLSRRLASRVGVVMLAWGVVFGGGLWVYARRRRRYLSSPHRKP